MMYEREGSQLQTRDPALGATRQFRYLLVFKREVHRVHQKLGGFLLFKAQVRVP